MARSDNDPPGSFEERFPRTLARTTAIILIVIGVMVLVGWAVGSDALIRLRRGYPPQYPNAALALIGAGIALGAVERGRRQLARIGAAVAIAIGGLTFLQYLLGFNLGIDTLLLPAADLEVRYPGRMAAGSALGLLLGGIALLALSVEQHTDAVDIVAGVLGVTVAVVGGLVLAGYLTGVLQELRQGFVAGMSLLGSLSLFLLGTSIVALAWRRDMALSTLPRWSAPAVGVAGVTATLLLWRALVQHDVERLEERLGYEAATARQAVAAQIDALIKDLSRLGRRTGQLPLPDWTADATDALRDVDLYDAVAWIDQRDSLRAVVPWTALARVDGLRRARQSAAIDTVRLHGFATDPVSAELLDDHRVLAVRVAACTTPASCNGELAGFINLNRLFVRTLGDGRRDFCTTVSTGGRIIFARQGADCRSDSRFGIAWLGVGRLAWTLTTSPSTALLSASTSPLPVVLLCLGLVVSGLLATSIRQTRTSWKLAREIERRQVTRALESATDGIWEWNLVSGGMVRGTMWRGLQYTDPEPPPTLEAWAERIHPEDLPHVRGAIEDHLAGRADGLVMEYRIRAADGSWHWLVDRARVVERTALGAPARVLGMYADITDRRAAAEALRASEERFRTMFDSAFQFQALLDLDGNLLEANRTALDFACLELPQVRGRPLWETRWWNGNAERESRLRQACEQARLGEIIQFQEELSGAAGKTATVVFSLKPVRDATGRVIQLIAEGHDVTDQKRAEDALRAVDALSTMGRLAARVAHEINNPLAGIQSSFMLLKDAVPPNHRYHRYVGAIEREIDRIATVTRELYGVYRAEIADRQESSIAVVISDAVALLNQLNRDASITIHTDTSRAPAVLPHPDALVRQVVFNLIQNAVEASPPNGAVAVEAWSDDGTFHLSVRDQGPGVPAAARERIFDDFYSTKTGLATAGMGLGLSIVRRSLRALRGEIEIHDSPGGGAEFRVRLPMT